MYPDLSYFFHDLLGTDVDNWSSIFKTFGLFLVLTFLTAHYLVKKELQRKESEGVLQPIKVKSNHNPMSDALINALMAFGFGFKIPYIYQNFEAFKADPAAAVFSGEGNFVTGILLGTLIGIYYYFDIKNKPQAPKGATLVAKSSDKTTNIIMIAALTGVLGSRLLSIMENWESFIADPLGQLLSGSGLTIYGGLILAGICVALYAKKSGIPVKHMADVAAPALMLGYGVGRMGCQFSGDGDWGIVNDNPKPDWFFLPDWAWAYEYPRNVAMEGKKIADCVGRYCQELSPPVYPTPIYEIAVSIILFLILWSLRKKWTTPGKLFFLYVFLTGLSRFFVEQIRVNPRYDLFGLDWSMSQTISAVLMVVGIIGILMMKGGKSGSGDKKKDLYAIPIMDQSPEDNPS